MGKNDSKEGWTVFFTLYEGHISYNNFVCLLWEKVKGLWYFLTSKVLFLYILFHELNRLTFWRCKSFQMQSFVE